MATPINPHVVPSTTEQVDLYNVFLSQSQQITQLLQLVNNLSAQAAAQQQSAAPVPPFRQFNTAEEGWQDYINQLQHHFAAYNISEVEPSFPYRDVQMRRGVDIRDVYDLQEEIGRGKFGTVYRCREKSTGLRLAAKMVSTPKRDDRRNVEREVDVMRVLQHPRLIQLYDAFDNGKTMCVVLELIEGGELFERVIDDDFILTEKSCTIFMRQICEGMEFIHSKHILHLDMKPENILCLTKTGNRIKIIDFGLARKFDPSKKLQVLFGTPEFVAPEVVNFEQIGFGTDMWSIGVICYVLLSGLSPFMGDTDVETMANVTIAKYDFDDEAFNEISDDAKNFIEKLLVKDIERRMTAAQALRHKWLQGVAAVTQLSTAKLKRYVIKKRWIKAVNTIIALRRMGAKLEPDNTGAA